MDIKIVSGALTTPYEYFCPTCLQLRLAFAASLICRNCGGGDIIKGEVGTLDKDKLIAEHETDKG